MDWNGKKVVVTGACGFIGSHLVEALLLRGASVRAFTYYNSFNTWGWIDSFEQDLKSKIDVYCGDIRDAYNVRDALEGMDIVFHLAALIAIPYSYIAPASYVKTNIEGTLNIVQAAKDFKTQRIIHTSTSEVYGTARYVPIDEAHPLQGQSPYSATKIGADAVAESFYRAFGLPVTIVRPFNTYGPRQSARAIIPTIVTQIEAGAKKIQLGSQHPTRDFTFVKDTVSAMIRLAETEDSIGKVTNIGSNFEITIGGLASKIMELMDASLTIEFDEKRARPSNSEVERLWADTTRLAATGWQPSYSLDEGLKQTIQWIRKNIDKYKADIYNV
ncbi:MAG: NAD-dependent 4,6-dehydratase LegB [Candidatus Magnetominusculus sp. LBB02]|nr:NAD-dependent 4,6-dehydratase LegB [Candidatus Magnetominusculus sp. LBB02]